MRKGTIVAATLCAGVLVVIFGVTLLAELCGASAGVAITIGTILGLAALNGSARVLGPRRRGGELPPRQRM
jgi:hypothetical protein